LVNITTGSFALQFREQITGDIPFNANSATVKQALESLSTITSALVTFSTGSAACTSSLSGNIMQITFVSELGILPCLQFLNWNVIDFINGNGAGGSGQIKIGCRGATLGGLTSIVGTRENAECSNHGACNRDLGICTCDLFYASSDGFGNPGVRGDCGYRLV